MVMFSNFSPYFVDFYNARMTQQQSKIDDIQSTDNQANITHICLKY